MTHLPRILAIETSGRHGSVAVAMGETVLASRELPPTSRHAIELMPAIDELTRGQGWEPGDIDHLYLSLGPGSFTGLRIAVAMARAMEQASGGRMKLVGVPSLDVIAHNVGPLDGAIVLPILDAKRAQIFAARYERQGTSGELVQTMAPGLYDPAAFLREAIDIAAQRAGCGGTGVELPVQIALVGEGIDYHRPALAAENLPVGLTVIEMPKSLWHGTAATVHRLGYARAQQGGFVEAAGLLPLYIRLPEAEEVYRRKHGLRLD